MYLLRLLEIPCEIMCRPKKTQPGSEVLEVKEEEESEEETEVGRLKRKASELKDRLKKVRRSGSGRTCFFTTLLFGDLSLLQK